MKKSILLLAVFAFFASKNQSQTVTDYDGNVYNTVTIGTQVWFKENLKVTHYRNGDLIGTTSPATLDISSESTPKYQWAYNGDEGNVFIYGRLYSWYAITDNRNICPTNWHIPTDGEWTTLVGFLGGGGGAGGKMKEIGTSHWKYINTGATNESGFTALPGGSRKASGTFIMIGQYSPWWSTTEDDVIDIVWFRYITNNAITVNRYYSDKLSGLSVRCLKDNSTQINETINKEKIDLYPNPATDKIYIDCSNSQDLTMQVYNSIGQCVLQRELNAQTNEIDISFLTRGIYILKLTSPNETIEKKIIKE